MSRATIFVILFVAIIVSQSCSPAGGENRGHEFMPDMVHSVAYEANLYNYYYYNTWGTEEEYKAYVEPRQPVAGTVARGQISVAAQSDPAARMAALGAFTGEEAPAAIALTPNGSVPYAYGNTDDERIRASQEIVDNPFPITTDGLERGKALYDIYCGICHGEAGDGVGYLVRDEDPAKGIVAGVYLAAPANFLLPQFMDTTNGMFYHSIMHGKNVMGAYADKLSYEERWQVIHYIRSLQAKSAGLEYTQDVNTYTRDLPGAEIVAAMQAQAEALQNAEDEHAEGEHHGDHGDAEEGHDGHDEH